MFNDYQVYIMVFILGIVQSLFQICSLSKIAELAGDTSNSSFVYGFMCFAEKVANGFSIYLFGKLAPMKHSPLEGDYFRVMMAIVFLVTSSVLGIIAAVESWWVHCKK